MYIRRLNGFSGSGQFLSFHPYQKNRPIVLLRSMRVREPYDRAGDLAQRPAACAHHRVANGLVTKLSTSSVQRLVESVRVAQQQVARAHVIARDVNDSSCPTPSGR